jgi:CHAT domain-containing protein
VNGTSVRLVHLPPAAGIESLVLEYQAAIHNSLADPLAAGSPSERLFRMLVEPVLPWIPTGTRVVIVPDRSLYAINFETLIVPGSKPRYWIEDVEVQAAPSLSLLTTETTPSPRGRTLLLFGDPAPHAPDFPALKYAAAEIENVSKHFPSDGVTAYQGERASPSSYKAATPGRFSFVHFTAHAAANIQSPLDSAVILSGDDARFKLYARDVADVPLRADLVTVSACRSAGERSYSGEGLIGFAWAFLRAGANRVIAGLWDVDDRSTVELMDRLYAEIASGKTPAQALRAAKLALIARGGNYAKPYYWGPFQIFTLVP